MTFRGFLRIACCVLAADACQSPRGEQPKVGTSTTQFVESAVADSILHLGDEAYGRSEYDSATQYYLKGREKARLEGDSTAVARADTWRGLAALRLVKNDEEKRSG